jgi:hypothetical protein
MSELLRYRYFKYIRRGTAPEPVIGVFIVGIPENVLTDGPFKTLYKDGMRNMVVKPRT